MTPIPITRAEYEKKFGVKPVVPAISILEDEKPAPIRVTRAEWEALQKEWEPKPLTFAQDAKSDIAETKQALLATADRGAQRSSEISQRVASGETSKAKGVFQKFGSALASTGNMVLDVGIGAAKAVLPQKAEDSVAAFFKGLGDVVTEKNADFYKQEVLPDLQSDDPDKRASAKFIVETLDAYKTDPNFKADVDASGGIIGALFAPTTKTAVSKTIDATTDVAKSSVKATGELASTVSKKLDTRSVNKVVDEIGKIEEKYAKSRSANSYQKPEEVSASRARIAESNVLDGAVDSNGIIRTEEAVTKYRKQTIDGMEDMVRQGLIESKETIPTAMVRQALVREVGKSGLEGADLVTALRKIDKEMEGLNTRIKGSSIVDLRYLHDNKIATTRNINYQTPPEKATYRKAIARAYKILVEENSKKVDVKGINEELKKFYGDIERIERLDGARAEGGRLGKYTASMAGTIIGGAAGSVGGGLGAAIGGIIGGEAAAALKGAGMARTFKGGGKGLPKSAVLEKARLSIPDKPVKAKAGIKKTKEITDLEKQISKNVAEQKKAIKAGNFELVAALKEVYEVLVDELKKLVKYLNENVSVGMSIRDVTKKTGTSGGFDGEMTLYRGVNNGNREGGNYFSTDREFARNFTQSGQDAEIKSIKLNTNDIYRAKELPFAGNESEITKAQSEARAKGFKAILVDEGKNQPPSVFLLDGVVPNKTSRLGQQPQTPPRRPEQKFDRLSSSNDTKSASSRNDVLPNTLYTEAKKYKTAEEFVKALPSGGKEGRDIGKGQAYDDAVRHGWKPGTGDELVTLYRGSKGEGLVDGDMLTSIRRHAEGFGKVTEYKIPKNKLIIKEPHPGLGGEPTYVYWTGETAKRLKQIWKDAQ